MRPFGSLGGQIGVFLDHARLSSELRDLDPDVTPTAENEVIFTIDEHSRVVFANSGLETVLGYKPEDLIGRSRCEIIPLRFREAHQRGLERYIRSGKRNISWDGVALPALHKNGSEIPMEIAFGEFKRLGQRVFTGFCRKTQS
jgi:two-component system sensor kinase FixL